MATASAAPTPDQQKLIDNERVKLLALALNNTAVAALATGALGPAASLLYGVTRLESPYSYAFALFWIAGAISLHAVAQLTLKELTP
jgi:lysozyme family protein